MWREGRRAVVLILIVDLSAFVIPMLLRSPFSRVDIQLAATLTSLSIAYSALTRRSERARRALHHEYQPVNYQSLLSIWYFPAALMLPMQFAWMVVVTAAVAEWPSRKATLGSNARLHRYVYSIAGGMLAVVAAHTVDQLIPGRRYLSQIVAAPAYMLVGVILVAAVMLAAKQKDAVRQLLRPSAHRVEFSSILIAAGIVCLVEARFGMLIWLSLPAAIVLQHITTRSKLEHTADEAVHKPMSEEAWLIAATEVVEALPVVAVMRITTADSAAVRAITEVQAGCDAIGYLGDNSVGMLLVDCPALSADALANRLRTAFHHHGIEASIAAAAKPRDGYCLSDLLAVCEAELIAREAASRSNKPSRPDG